MSEELKPCPFCGGPMTLRVSRSNGHQIFGKHTKDCAFSDISACMQEPSNCEWVADEIIKRWNTRAALPVREAVGGDQVVGRVHHNSEHAEPVRAVLNSIGRQLPDDAPLYTHPATTVPAGSRVVQVELLERCAGILESQGFSAWDDIAREIRALLEVKP